MEWRYVVKVRIGLIGPQSVSQDGTMEGSWLLIEEMSSHGLAIIYIAVTRRMQTNPLLQFFDSSLILFYSLKLGYKLWR